MQGVDNGPRMRVAFRGTLRQGRLYTVYGVLVAAKGIAMDRCGTISSSPLYARGTMRTISPWPLRLCAIAARRAPAHATPRGWKRPWHFLILQTPRVQERTTAQDP